jgi:hypothetical protein
VPAQQHDRAVAQRGGHLRGQRPGADQDTARIDRHAAGRQAGARDVERSDDRPDRQAGEVRHDHVLRVGMHDRGHVRAPAQHLGVQRQLLRDTPAVQLAAGSGRAVEADQPDVLRGGPGQAAFPRATAAHE